MKTNNTQDTETQSFIDIAKALEEFDSLRARSSHHYVIAQGLNGNYYVMLKDEAEGLKNILVDRPTFTDSLAAEEERAHLEETYKARFAIRYNHDGSMYVCRT